MTDWEEGPVRVLVGDTRERLRDLPAESVHCVVTSPPYWGLRDYGIAGQLGLEATPEEYVAAMVDVFREVRRVLRPDGTLWLNLGDSYAGSWGNQGRKPERGTQRPINGPMLTPVLDGRYPSRESNTGQTPPGLKPKDLVGIPWRVAFALQADGWWLRSDIVWAKPNPMPESVTDRPTKAHEYLFLLTRSERYFYDAEAVREPAAESTAERAYLGKRPISERHEAMQAAGMHGKSDSLRIYDRVARNLRSVWTIATQPYPEAHFATFPEELARRCIAAGTSEQGCCPECGAPWRRVVERSTNGGHLGSDTMDGNTRNNYGGQKVWDAYVAPKTTGWEPTCAHATKPVPCIVLDPFAGSGTTLAVARRMGRRAVGVELQADYLPLIQNRVTDASLPLLEVP